MKIVKKENLGLQIIQVEADDLEQIEGERCRTFETKPKSIPLSATMIWDDIQTHQRKRVIAICNTVDKVQGLYRDLKTLNQDERLKLTLLHSRFLPEDRAKKEKDIQGNEQESTKGEFAKGWEDTGKCHVLIATQVIEAGINITCQVMHSEICPMNSLLQRAGRCARFQGETGKIYVYWDVKVSQNNQDFSENDSEAEPEKNSNERNNFKPYSKDVCQLTWDVLEDRSPEEIKQKVGFSIEQQWINKVHKEQDLAQLERQSESKMEFEKLFDAAVRTGDESARRDLIRKTDSITIFIPQQVFYTNCESVIPCEGEPVDFQQLVPFSLPSSTLYYRGYKKNQDRNNTSWILMSIQNTPNREEKYSQPVYSAIASIKSPQHLKNYTRLIINPALVAYDREIGLVLEPNAANPDRDSPRNAPQLKPTVSEYKHYMDIYEGHLIRLWAYWQKPFPSRPLTKCDHPIYQSVRDELLKPAGRYINERIFPDLKNMQKAEELFEYLVFFAVLTHDLGKLQTRWQEVMRGWQKIVYDEFKNQTRRSDPKSYLLAHTDYDPEVPEQKERMNKSDKRPPHAVEGAFLACDLLLQFLEPLLRQHYNANDKQVEGILWTVVLAAGRHHYAWARGEKLAKEIRLHKDARKAIAASLRSLVKVLPDTLPMRDRLKTLELSANRKSKSGELIYDTAGFELNNFRETQIKYHYLYLLVVRALRLCDQRAVQWEFSSTHRDS